ncbi:MAG: hypothetical protein ACTSQU_05205 [Promethearchaeota archaeon]
MENKEIVKNLVIIGSIIGLLQAIFALGGWGLGYYITNNYQLYGNILLSIIGIILAILTLLSVFRPGNPIPYSAVFLIILGVLMTFFNAWIGGVVVLIAGILWLVWKL